MDFFRQSLGPMVKCFRDSGIYSSTYMAVYIVLSLYASRPTMGIAVSHTVIHEIYDVPHTTLRFFWLILGSGKLSDEGSHWSRSHGLGRCFGLLVVVFSGRHTLTGASTFHLGS